MSLSTLAQNLRKQASENSGLITINQATLTQAGLTPPDGLDASLTGAYQLKDGGNLQVDTSGTTIPDPVGDALTITQAQAAVLNVEQKYTSVTLVFTSSGSDVQFTILIQLSNWTFATSFQYMTGGVFSTLPYASPAFIFSTEAVASFDWMSFQIALVAGQNFAAEIKLTGILQKVTEFLTSWDGNTGLALA
ncbi:MAG: hypothetical protein AAFR59_08445, partial [Bacteroidota bacterium]